MHSLSEEALKIGLVVTVIDPRSHHYKQTGQVWRIYRSSIPTTVSVSINGDLFRFRLAQLAPV